MTAPRIDAYKESLHAPGSIGARGWCSSCRKREASRNRKAFWTVTTEAGVILALCHEHAGRFAWENNLRFGRRPSRSRRQAGKVVRLIAGSAV